jgi:hypothetical protein
MQGAPLPTVTRTGNAAIDRNLDAIHNAFRRIGKLVAPIVNASTTFIDEGGGLAVPAPYVTPGLLQLGVETVTTVAGIIPAPTTSNTLVVTVDSGKQVIGMDTAGLNSGTIFYLTFKNAPGKLLSGATVGSGQAPFDLGYTYRNGIAWPTHAPASGIFQYFATELGSARFRMISAGLCV